MFCGEFLEIIRVAAVLFLLISNKNKTEGNCHYDYNCYYCFYDFVPKKEVFFKNNKKSVWNVEIVSYFYPSAVVFWEETLQNSLTRFVLRRFNTSKFLIHFAQKRLNGISLWTRKWHEKIVAMSILVFFLAVEVENTDFSKRNYKWEFLWKGFKRCFKKGF